MRHFSPSESDPANDTQNSTTDERSEIQQCVSTSKTGDHANTPNVNSYKFKATEETSETATKNLSTQPMKENLIDHPVDDNRQHTFTQEQLIQNIIKSADMACKAKRMNQLMSYLSGIDYSSGHESASDQAVHNPKPQKLSHARRAL